MEVFLFLNFKVSLPEIKKIKKFCASFAQKRIELRSSAKASSL